MKRAIAMLLLLTGCEREPPAAPPAPDPVARHAVPPADPLAQYPLDRIPQPERPGAPMRNPDIRPRLIESVEPKYPEEARRARISGMVVLDLVIEADGRVSSGVVLKPLPMGLSQAAIDAVGKWRFEPARHQGQPVRALHSVTVAMRPPAQ